MGTTRKPQTKRSTTAKKRSTSSRQSYKRTQKDIEVARDIKIILFVCVCIFIFVCNFNLVGKFGAALSGFFFGVFGLLNYIVAVFAAGLYIYVSMSAGRKGLVVKCIASGALFILVSMIVDLINGISANLQKYSVKELYEYSKSTHKGGGVIAASFNYGLLSLIDMVGTLIVIGALILICIVLLTEKSLVNSVRDTREFMHELKDEDRRLKAEMYEDRRAEAARRREEKMIRAREEREAREKELLARKEAEKHAKMDEEVLRKNRKVVGVTSDTTLVSEPVTELPKQQKTVGDVHEITLNTFDPATLTYEEPDIPINGVVEPVTPPEPVYTPKPQPVAEPSLGIGKNTSEIKKPVATKPAEPSYTPSFDSADYSGYKLPPLDLLSKGSKKAGDSAQSIRQTAQKLQDTLAVFGVEATVTDISQGPTVTRFELQPKLGVKVSRIKNLSDDIKLSLAASEIRIEAPIPGKAAIGIEVPNKESQPVLLRDLLESSEFKSFDSNLSFAVGKDITGKTIVYNINSFPHLLIAGATGSGKSVCINTMIMSILYKASPDDVKLIMIDPKVVELSVYNGIPHLMLPVVTDIKKAAATLNYAVTEMHERFKKFAEYGVRDIEGYLSALKANGELEEKKMPHLVIIVDEVADLMLAERKNVEDSIQSLTQLARAAGIHLIIATQRPSVDVITGVIKANMPSRIAFAVSSNVDSRTILDMGGAEELLGKGDMLFFPKGLKKPVRLQGGFVSDKEVNDVVEFVKKQGTPAYDSMIEEKIKSLEKKTDNGSGTSAGDAADDGNDPMLTDVGFYVIDSNKASIGNIQRKFKMGFNRAARIMDSLADIGVVGPEEGTKPRQILMSRDQFENYLEEYGG
ncbi:MAG: DNA translocase FtsK [Lachnospiraceae bacterium]|nr:DNA translocase FtsK [Lachnospiraceae bacterium]